MIVPICNEELNELAYLDPNRETSPYVGGEEISLWGSNSALSCHQQSR